MLLVQPLHEWWRKDKTRSVFHRVYVPHHKQGCFLIDTMPLLCGAEIDGDRGIRSEVE